MARRVARLLRPGEYVNLGTGMPTLVSDHLEPAQAITLHSENGMLGIGPLACLGLRRVARRSARSGIAG